MFFKKRKEAQKKLQEEMLISALFGDFNESQADKLLPGISVLTRTNQWETVKQMLLQRTSNAESRLRFFAWCKLRHLSVLPDETAANEVLGVVIQVNMREGIDYLAAYSDNCARYYNYSGAKVIYEQYNDEAINSKIRQLLSHCAAITDSLIFDEGAWRQPPGLDMARINVLMPKGLFMCEGPLDVLQQSELTHNVMSHGVAVMTALIELSQAKNGV